MLCQRIPLRAVFGWSLLLAVTGSGVRAATPGVGIDFARDIRPILASRCYDCHGAEKPKGGLQLTTRQNALRGGESGEPAIVPGDRAHSPLLQRLTTTEEEDVMPRKGERLTPAQVGLLGLWIEQGAVWPENIKHWAYTGPVRPAVPAVANPAWRARNPIDHFILARLAPEGLAPSPEADRARWLRRVSLDLIGLPPTQAEVDAFLAEAGERAFERVVDRLLASPHYGERWARPWLDLARYADSHGFQRDDLRESWPYRDWVIRAMNAGMPFDQFTVWQLAGDLLPEVRNAKPGGRNLDPLIATGFNRCAPTNVEAGADQEEGRVTQVFDRVNTTAAVWLGTTMECAQCHNHKFDPFTQKEYYQLFAFFNNTARETEFATAKAMATLRFADPYLRLPDAAQDERRRALEPQLSQIEARIESRRRQLRAGQEAWERSARDALDSSGQIHPLDVAEFDSAGESDHRLLPDKSVLLVDDAPDRDTYTVTVHTALTGITGFKLEALSDPSLPGGGPGRGAGDRPNFVLNGFRVSVATGGGAAAPVRLVRASASFSQRNFAVENLLTPGSDNRSGWAISPRFRQDHWAIFETDQPLGAAGGTTLRFTLVQNFGAGRTIGRLRLSALTGQAGNQPTPAEIAIILRTPPATRTARQTARLDEYHLAQDQGLGDLRRAKLTLEQELDAVRGPQTLVMRELEQPRPTAVLDRGNFLAPKEPVQPGTPAALPPLAAAPGAPSRLELARWLVARDNPLVARVTVNRWWAEFFGRGLVSTLEDFGLKGEPPTHPELLDWLAVEFMEHGWSMKHLHKLIVLSATYRQSSRVTPELLARDDQNKLYARGPRFRLDAEAIRDNALAAAGLLSLKMGGPPVRPYQPPGLWDNKVGGDRVTYEVSAGEDAWRRGIYTVWKRSSPYPSFVNFDATARTACTIRRSRSNTPLQALTLLNDPVYVAAALATAKRVLTECPDGTTEERIRHAFRLCLTRLPTAGEIAVLRNLCEQQAAAYAADAAAAKTVVGDAALPPGVSAAAVATWQAVATALMNLDEMITKG